MSGELAHYDQAHLVIRLLTVLLGRLFRSHAFLDMTVRRWLRSFPHRTGMHVVTFLEEVFRTVLADRLKFEVVLQKGGGNRPPVVSTFYLFSGTREESRVSLPMYAAEMEEVEREMLTNLVPFFGSQWRGTGISYSIRCVSFPHMDAVTKATDRVAVARHIVYAVLEQALAAPGAPRTSIRWMTVAALRIGPEAAGLVEVLADPSPIWREMARRHAPQFRRWCTDNYPETAQYIWPH
mgnify:CR=1 FL=1